MQGQTPFGFVGPGLFYFMVDFRVEDLINFIYQFHPLNRRKGFDLLQYFLRGLCHKLLLLTLFFNINLFQNFFNPIHLLSQLISPCFIKHKVISAKMSETALLLPIISYALP